MMMMMIVRIVWARETRGDYEQKQPKQQEEREQIRKGSSEKCCEPRGADREAASDGDNIDCMDEWYGWMNCRKRCFCIDKK